MILHAQIFKQGGSSIVSVADYTPSQSTQLLPKNISDECIKVIHYINKSRKSLEENTADPERTPVT